MGLLVPRWEFKHVTDSASEESWHRTGITIGGTGELAVGSRSMLQIKQTFASYTDVPQVDLRDGRATPSLSPINSASRSEPVKIKCSKEKSANAFAAMHYRDR